jgi:serine protease Do
MIATKYATLRVFVLLGLVGVLPVAAQEAEPAKQPNGDLDLARRLENAFVKVADEASQSVVVITGSRRSSDPGKMTEEDLEQFEGSPFDFFFQREGSPTPEPRDYDSQGSGIIYRKDGHILTNNHVVEGARKLKVRLKDGRVFDAKVVGKDPRTDVAVVKITGDNLPVARLADSDKVKSGQWAIAIGAPFELDYSFTVGFVSATGRQSITSPSGSAYEDYIQTDASINPGNSGGPLCNIQGEVMGINTLIRGMNRGIGFAIPINLAREVADQLIDKGRIMRPWLGVQIDALANDKELLAKVKDVVTDGVVVRGVYPDTPAARSDLKASDIITAVDGVVVKSARDLQKVILGKKIGQKITLDVIHEGKAAKVILTTTELPTEGEVLARPPGGKQAEQKAFGLTVQSLTAELAEKFKSPDDEGVVVTDVTAESVAKAKGLKSGDVITQVDRQPVKTAEEFAKAMEKGDAKKGILLYVKREGAASFVVLKTEK